MKKAHKITSMFVMLIMVCIAGTGVSAPLLSQEGIEFDEYEIKDAINSYFLMRYKTFQSNDPLDFSMIFNSQDNDIEWLKLEQDKRDIEIAIHTTWNQRILAYSFKLDFKTIEMDQSTAVVELLENNEITYESNPLHPSAMANVEHEINLLKTDDGWVITKDTYTDDLSRLLRYSSKDEIFKNIELNHDRSLNDSPTLNQNTFLQQNPAFTEGLHLYDYNNAIAVTYADSYWDSEATEAQFL